MKQPIYIFSDGELQRKQNTISFVDSEGKRKYIPVEGTSELYIFGEVDLNKRLLEFLTRSEILIHFFNPFPVRTIPFSLRETNTSASGASR